MSSSSQPAQLYVCVLVSEFAAQALLRLRPEQRALPCVVMEGEPPLVTVCAMTSRARALGVIQGMTQVEIETFPGITPLHRSLAEEESARAVMLECAGAYSPRIEEQSSNGNYLCVLDISGTEKLLGPPLDIARSLLEHTKRLGFSTSIAVSRNFHASVSMARGLTSQKPVSIIRIGSESAALAPLPLSVLDLGATHRETFALWGINTLGMLADLPEKELVARMGQEGKRLRQLARGELPHLFRPVEAAFALEEHMELDTPVELLDSLLFVLGLMLEQVILRAVTRILALASVTVTLSLEGGTYHARTVRPALPSNDRQMWLKLIHLDIEAHPPHAAVLALTLMADPGTTSKVQLGLFSPQLPEPMRLDVTMARIRAIVGEHSVGRVRLKDTNRSEGFDVETFRVEGATPTRNRDQRERLAVRQLRPAESITLTLRNREPVAFMFRDKHYVIEDAYGPWNSSGEWWNPTLWHDEQWDVVARRSDGLLLCCCLIHNLSKDHWQMAALYD